MANLKSSDSTRRCHRPLLAAPIVLVILACSATTPTPSPPPEVVEAAPTTPAPQPVLAPQPGDTTRHLEHEGVDREYLLHIPTGYDAARPTPLVLAFHGISLDAEEMARISGFSEQADASGFVVAYPNGSGSNKSWNGGHCCGEAAKNNVDDVGFVRAVIGDISTIINLDSERIYATGFSNGALFVYRLACDLSDLIAAIGPVGATQILEDEQSCRPARGVPVIHFHGTADRLNPYDGGTTAAGYEWVSVPHAIETWAKQNGCPASPSQSESGSIVHEVYQPCSQNATVELYKVAEGEHAWPGGEAVSEQVGEPTMEILATPLMWGFFAAHPMP